MENYLGLVDRDPEPIAYDPVRASDYVGMNSTRITVLINSAAALSRFL
ncbi:hypothetical protein GCM10009765_75300 [Fodinicola feengrottensis]|uniref:Uncharacterized protein n=1 Tax=Fodinicola feengrottensis TaxID=435914 RepID=A0ABN2J093_9ACTN